MVLWMLEWVEKYTDRILLLIFFFNSYCSKEDLETTFYLEGNYLLSGERMLVLTLVWQSLTKERPTDSTVQVLLKPTY